MTIFRFPHTPHLAWLSRAEPRGDKVLSVADAANLLRREVVVEEKVDGANLGISVADEGTIQVQNRGTYLNPQTAHPQFRPLWAWLGPRQEALIDTLWPDLVLFGEWCLAVHSIPYDSLPDWFLVFDVYDKQSGSFWECAHRDILADQLQLQVVPRLWRGQTNLADLCERMGTSRLGKAPMEGVIVRAEANGRVVQRAKLVRPSFTQAIDEHWSKGPFQKNQRVGDYKRSDETS